MLSQLVPLALLWALSLVVAGVRAQSENDFENSPAIKKVSVSIASCVVLQFGCIEKLTTWHRR
jgi:small basic protein